MPSPVSPGYRFKDGKLMIFQADEVILIHGWDQLSALRKSDGYWNPFIPEFRLVAPYRRTKPARKKEQNKPLPSATTGQLDFGLWDVSHAAKPVPPKTTIPKASSLSEQRKRAFDAFRFSLPKEVARVVEGFRSHQWHLLYLLSQDAYMLDLAKTNPVLAFAVADWHADHLSTRRNLGRMPQRDLLALLKLPDTAAVVKLFRKIPPESIDPRMWKPLLGILRQPDGACSKLLAHVPEINLGVMELILTPQLLMVVTPTLLEDVASDPKEKYKGAVAAMIRDTLAMQHELAIDRPLTSLVSVARLRAEHAAISADFQNLKALRQSYGDLPIPPVPGVKDQIVPLRSQAELMAEGREQHNCVASYTRRVVVRDCYIYKVLHPSRATLSISLQNDGSWGISELKGACNAAVDGATRDFVNDWLDLYRLGI